VARLAGRVDLIAVSVDGPPEDHNRMRGSPHAFSKMAAGLRRLAGSGIQFGVIFTLTQYNVHQLEDVATFASDVGAGLLQVHPLEAEGFATTQLPDAVPDIRELAFAMVECARIRETTGLHVQLDVLRRHDLVDRPEQFLALDAAPDAPLGSWLSPLVVETSGRVVPLTYGIDADLAFGVLGDGTGLAQLAESWLAGPCDSMFARCRLAREHLIDTDGPLFVNWYGAVAHGSHLVEA